MTAKTQQKIVFGILRAMSLLVVAILAIILGFIFLMGLNPFHGTS